MKFALLSLVTLLFVSCNSTAPIVIKRVPFNPDEYEKFKKEGTAIVSGQGFMKTAGGDVKYAAGNKVALSPVTSYSDQWYNEFYLKVNHKRPNMTFDKTDPRYLEAILNTTADGEGRFTFKNVPAGDYYLGTEVFWQAPSEYGLITQGGGITKKVTIKEGESHNFILTR